MTNSKTTKRALLSSVLAIVLCLTMLIGTTFAWFTDTASTGVNKIQAGNLDIDVEYTLDGTNWEKLDEATNLFQKGLWEPGHTEVVGLKVKNAGNLALKYNISFNVVSDNVGVNKDGQEYRLSDYLKVKTYTTSAPLADMNEYMSVINAFGIAFTSRDDMGIPYTDADFADLGALCSNVSLIPGKEDHLLLLKVYMPETVGNEANALSAEEAASIDFGINVVATQLNSESDSFGPDYDESAKYPVSDNASLSEALENIAAGETMDIAAGEFALPDGAALPQGVAINGAGVDKTTLTAPATQSGNQVTGLVVNDSGVKISNATINGNSDITSDMYCGVVDIREGGTTMENVKVVNRTSLASGVVIKNGVGTGETVALKNMTFNVYYRALYIVDGANGTIEVSNSDITGSVYALNVNSNSSQDLVLKFTNSKLHGWSSYGKIKSASFENVEFSKGGSDYDYLRPYADTTLKNCTFDSEFLMGAGTTGFNITIENCTFNGVAVTAANVSSMLDRDDLTNLKGCTITVNGETVTL